jgi:hypothetical protein
MPSTQSPEQLTERAKRERKEIVHLFRLLCRQPKHTFPALYGTLHAPSGQGVYIIRDPWEIVVHVGRTLRGKYGLWQRLKDHLGGSSSFKREYLKGDGGKLRERYTYQCLEIKDARQRALVEAFGCAWFCPAHLGLGEKR